MKILEISENFTPISGGIRSFINLTYELKKKHDVYIFTCNQKNKDSGIDNVIYYNNEIMQVPKLNKYPYVFNWVRQYFLLEKVKPLLKKKIYLIKPDIIIAQAHFAIPAVEIANELNIPVLLFIRCPLPLCPIRFEDKNPFDCKGECWKCLNTINSGQLSSFHHKIQYPFIIKLFKWHKFANENADLIFANSDYMKRMLDYFGIQSKIVYPFINLSKYQLLSDRNNPKYILFIKPEYHKGVNIFLRIAKIMKNEKFLVIGKAPPSIIKRLNKLQNITYISWIKNINEIYLKTKLIIMPSIWPEAFGRVPIEAGINGVPTIASNRGGLPESVGNGGVLINDIYNIDNWINEIKNITENNEVYSRFSLNAKKHAEKFDIKNTYGKFKKILRDELKIEL